jgi:hypothetical protein
MEGYFADTNAHSTKKDDIWEQSETIKGRCGYIRQSFPFVITDYNFSRV